MPDGSRPERTATHWRLKKYLPPALGVLVLAAVVFGLHRALAKIGVADVLHAVAGTPRAEFAHALELTAMSFGIMAIYDIPGILFARRMETFPRLGLPRVGLVSSCAYALSHVLGAPALSGAAIRYRFYAQWGVPAAGIARIVALSGVMFTLGAAVLLGGILVLEPADVPLFGGSLPDGALRAIGLLLWLLPAGYVAAAGGNRPFRLLGKTIPRPGPALAVAQICLSCADTACACAILFALLPDSAGLSYSHLLGIYLAAFAGGLVSAIPGGVGVFDSLLLLGLAGTTDTARALAAILLFRLLYYLAPAILAASLFAGHEMYVGLVRRRRGQAG
jgi:uncharacterized membrane protein YbhN (UPF0104 family)